jgi:hypothetical protein
MFSYMGAFPLAVQVGTTSWEPAMCRRPEQVCEEKAEKVVEQKLGPDEWKGTAIGSFSGYSGTSCVVLVRAERKVKPHSRTFYVVKSYVSELDEPEADRELHDELLTREYENCLALREVIAERYGEYCQWPIVLVDVELVITEDGSRALLFPAAHAIRSIHAPAAKQLGDVLKRGDAWDEVLRSIIESLYRELNTCLYHYEAGGQDVTASLHTYYWSDEKFQELCESFPDEFDSLFQVRATADRETVDVSVMATDEEDAAQDLHRRASRAKTLLNPLWVARQIEKKPFDHRRSRVIYDLNLGNVLCVDGLGPVVVDLEKAKVRENELCHVAVDFAKLEAEIVCHCLQTVSFRDLALLWLALPPKVGTGGGFMEELSRSAPESFGVSERMAQALVHVRERAHRFVPPYGDDTYGFDDYYASLLHTSCDILQHPLEHDKKRRLGIWATLAATATLQPLRLREDLLPEEYRGVFSRVLREVTFEPPFAMEVNEADGPRVDAGGGYAKRARLRLVFGFWPAILVGGESDRLPPCAGCKLVTVRVRMSDNGEILKRPYWKSADAVNVKRYFPGRRENTFVIEPRHSGQPLSGSVEIELEVQRHTEAPVLGRATLQSTFCPLDSSGSCVSFGEHGPTGDFDFHRWFEGVVVRRGQNQLIRNFELFE